MKKIALILLGISVLAACGNEPAQEVAKPTASEAEQQVKQATDKKITANLEQAKASASESMAAAKDAAIKSAEAAKLKSQQVYDDAKKQAADLLEQTKGQAAAKKDSLIDQATQKLAQ